MKHTRRTNLYCFTAILITLSVGRCTDGQLVQIGPGYVKAPFVRVITGPQGTHVQAPFVNINTPPRPYVVHEGPITRGYRPLASVGAASESAVSPDTSQLSRSELRVMAREGVTLLEEQLDRLPGQHGWHQYLQIATLKEHFADGSVAAPQPEERDVLVKILAPYLATRNTPEFSRITSLSGFVEVHAALEALTRSEEARQPTTLQDAAQQLYRELAQLGSGTGWREYLRIPELDGDVSATGPSLARPESELDLLLRVKSHYDRVQREPRFRRVAELPGFQATHTELTRWIDVMRDNEPEEALPDPAIEILPLPKKKK